MSPILLIGVGVVYFIVAIQYCLIHRYGMALAFIAYALANAGFAWDVLRSVK